MGLGQRYEIGHLERPAIGLDGRVRLSADSMHIAASDEQIDAMRMLVVGRLLRDDLSFFEPGQRFLDLSDGHQRLDEVGGNRQRRAMWAAFDSMIRLQRVLAEPDRSVVVAGDKGSTARGLETGEERVRRGICLVDQRLDMAEMFLRLRRARKRDGQYRLLDAVL